MRFSLPCHPDIRYLLGNLVEGGHHGTGRSEIEILAAVAGAILQGSRTTMGTVNIQENGINDYAIGLCGIAGGLFAVVDIAVRDGAFGGAIAPKPVLGVQSVG